MSYPYASANEQEACEELVRILEFHSVEDARITAGSWLVKLGQRDVVAESVKNEISPKVLAALHQRLL